MANEIWHNFEEGKTLYALIFKKSDDKVNIQGTNNFEAWNDANIATYDHPMTDHDGGYYTVDFPTTITGTVLTTYRISVVLQAGGSPNADSAVDFRIAQGELFWDGTSEVDLGTLTITNSTIINNYDDTTSAPNLIVINDL